MNHLVSVIVPAYNAGDYIISCVDNLQSQSYKNIEIIIVEDCSSDNTAVLCRQLMQENTNVRLIQHTKNTGQAVARNDGINAAHGEYIMFLDADDTFSFDGISSAVSFADTNNLDFALAPYTEIRGNTKKTVGSSLEKGVYSAKEITNFLFDKISWNTLSCIGSKIYRKSFLDLKNIRFEKELKFNEDGAFALKCIKEATNIGFMDNPFYQYNIRTTGSTQSSYRKDMFTFISRTDYRLKQLLCTFDLFDASRKNIFFQKRCSLYINSLINEIKYSNYKSYLSTIKTIKAFEDYEEVKSYITKTSFNKKFKIMIFCLENKLYALLYFLLRLKLKI